MNPNDKTFKVVCKNAHGTGQRTFQIEASSRFDAMDIATEQCPSDYYARMCVVI
jgi:hypothetical protein